MVLILIFLLLISLLAMSVLFTTDVEYATSQSYQDRAAALHDTDSALNEILYRMNLTQGAGAPPAGSRVTINSLSDYDAFIPYDPQDVLSNNVDDDGDGIVDDSDEMQLTRDWTVRVLLTSSATHPGSPWEVSDTNIAAGPPWGTKLVLPSLQPSASWRSYTSTDAAASDVLTLRFKLDTDTPPGDSEGDGAEIVYYDRMLTRNWQDDKNTLTGLGGDGDPNNDSAYCITWSDGTNTYPSFGRPIILAEVMGRTVRAGRTVASRRIQADIYHDRWQRPVLDKAVCGCTDVALGGPTDSYKSSAGSYGSGAVYQNGDVGCNGTIALGGGGLIGGSTESGGITTLNGADIQHDATSGATVVKGVIGGNVLGSIFENVLPVPHPCDCSAYDVAALAAAAKASNDNATAILPDNEHPYEYGTATIDTKSQIWKKPGQLDIGTSMSIILTGGTYYCESIGMAGVNAIIQVGRDTDGDGWVDQPPLQPAKIYVDGGSVSVSSSGILNLGRPFDLQIYVSSPTKPVNISGSFTFTGVIYHPGNLVKVSGGAVVHGAILANEVQGGGDAIHYDEDLLRQMTVVEDNGMKLLAWREVP